MSGWGAGSGRGFDALADDYEAGRPGYPDALLDLLGSAAAPAGTLAGAAVLDVGAGTGIASRALAGRGARVLAADPGPGMLARLRGRAPAIPAVVALAERLPFADRCADLVCFAQAWHWVEVPRAAAEVVRVLRPGGALAVWWNDPADDQPWYAAQQDRLEAAIDGYRRSYRDRDYGAELSATGRFGPVSAHRLRWARRIDLDTYARWLRSKSYVASLGDRMEPFVAGELRHLRAEFGDGPVYEPFVLRLWVARTAS